MVADVSDTLCPAVTFREDMTISKAEDCPIVNPLATIVPVESSILAEPRIPELAAAKSTKGVPENVRTPPATVPDGLARVMLEIIRAIPEVPSLRTPLPGPASILVTTALRREFRVAVLYVMVIILQT
jgi:hypothetical protein